MSVEYSGNDTPLTFKLKQSAINTVKKLLPNTTEQTVSLFSYFNVVMKINFITQRIPKLVIKIFYSFHHFDSQLNKLPELA